MNDRNFLVVWPVAVSTLVLLLNDHLLKALFPGWITGKLSDFAGIFLVTYILIGLSKGRVLVSCLSVATLFILWKSPYSQTIIDIFNSYSLINVGRVIDYTDLLAFGMLPAAAYVYRNRVDFSVEANLSKLVKIPLIILTSLAIAGTSASVPHHKYAIRKSEPTQKIDVDKVVFLIGEVARNNSLTCANCTPGAHKGHYKNKEINMYYSISPDGRGVEFEITGMMGILFLDDGSRSEMEGIRDQLASKLSSEFDGMELVIKLNGSGL